MCETLVFPEGLCDRFCVFCVLQNKFTVWNQLLEAVELRQERVGTQTRRVQQ